ncbi:MAG TPA: hypothetical protein VFF04_06890 [Candidatus Babeliales bacterium]|nr:hypothetical protein [Candidatus Babeliales bacterium]
MTLQHVKRIALSLLSLTIGFAFANDNRLASNEPSAPELPIDYQAREYMPESDYEHEQPHALSAKPHSFNPAWEKQQAHPLVTDHKETTEDVQQFTLKPEDIKRSDLRTNYEKIAAIEQLKIFLNNNQGDLAASFYAKTLSTNGEVCKEEALFVISGFSGKPVIETMIKYFEKTNDAVALADIHNVSVIQNRDNIQATKAEQAGKRVQQKEAQKRIKRGPLAWLASIFR